MNPLRPIPPYPYLNKRWLRKHLKRFMPGILKEDYAEMIRLQEKYAEKERRRERRRK